MRHKSPLSAALLALALLATLALPLAATAQADFPGEHRGEDALAPPPPPPRPDPSHQLHRWIELQLSDTQMEQLLDLQRDHLLAMRPQLRKMVELHKQATALSDDPVGNEEELKRIAARLAELRVEGRAAAARLEQAGQALLSASQREALAGSALYAPPPPLPARLGKGLRAHPPHAPRLPKRAAGR